jgi:hypothetical protein
LSGARTAMPLRLQTSSIQVAESAPLRSSSSAPQAYASAGSSSAPQAYALVA